jgi:hypothetical protein
MLSHKTRCLVGAFTQFEQLYNGMHELAEYFEQPMLPMPSLMLRMLQSFVQTVPSSDVTSSLSPLHAVPDLNPALRSVLKELKAKDGLNLSAEDVRDRLGVVDFDFNLPVPSPKVTTETEIPDPKPKPPISKARAAAVSTEEPTRGRNTYRGRGGGGRGGGADSDGYSRQRSTSRKPPATHCGLCGKSDHVNAGNCPQIEDSKWVPARDGVYQQMKCWNCLNHGHHRDDCPGTLMADKLLANRNKRFLEKERREEATANLAAAQPAAPNPWDKLNRDDGRYSALSDDDRSETGSDTSEEWRSARDG